MNREILAEFNRGEAMPAGRFTNGGLDIYGDIVHPMWVKEEATKQPSLNMYPFYGEVFYQRVLPLVPDKTPEQQHLAEVRELKKGITQTLVMNFDNDMDKMRISEIREELNELRG